MKNLIGLILVNSALVVLVVFAIRIALAGRRYDAIAGEALHIDGSPQQVIGMVEQAVQGMGFMLQPSRLNEVAFRTKLSLYSWRGQAITVSVLDNGDDTCAVRASGKRNPSPQVYDWGESGRIIARLFSAIREQHTHGT